MARGRPMNGWLALSPLFVFLVVYVATSVISGDFYKVPITSAFLVASAYALLVTPGNMESKISVFSDGAGDKNVLLMIWIFILAGAFASTAEDIGAIDATVELTLRILPGKFIYAGLFLASCFVSMSIGTSVGTIVALVPVGAGLSQETGIDLAFITGIIAGGAFFGDNLSFISDTTIAATRTQECTMADKFKVNIAIAGPAAALITVFYIFQGDSAAVHQSQDALDWIKLIPYVTVIGTAISGINVISVLAIGITLNAVIGIGGGMGPADFLGSVGKGIGGMGELIIVTMIAGGMLGVIKHNGGLDFIIRGLTGRIKGKRGAEASIGLLVSLVNLCTANNTIAIITTGHIAKDIGREFGLDSRKTASILDTFSCFVQGMLPYGAQMLMASGLAGISATAIIGKLYYPFALGIFAVLSIILRFPKKYS